MVGCYFVKFFSFSEPVGSLPNTLKQGVDDPMPKICIDPGHNSSQADTGAQANGLNEQDLNLDIARRLRTFLQINGFEVAMTRDGDFVNGPHATLNESLKSRCDIANSFAADLFVSIHVNAGGGTGTEVYALPGGQAVVAAQRVLERLVYACNWANRGVKTDRAFYVLVHTDMPAILTENGFIDSGDANKLANSGFRQSIAEAHARGICDFFGISYQQTPVVSAQNPESDSGMVQQPIQSALKTAIMGYENSLPVPPTISPPVSTEKTWYDSKTLWVNTVLFASVMAQQISGHAILTPEIQASIITVINVVLRLVTKDKITWK
ncbi:MAG: N-acetylmuramoyl-L-alanine amidase [Desulfitobacteriaceae bacterium]